MNTTDTQLCAAVAEVIGVRQSDKQIVEFGLFDPLNNPADTWMVAAWIHKYSIEPVWLDLWAATPERLARAFCEAVAGLKT